MDLEEKLALGCPWVMGPVLIMGPVPMKVDRDCSAVYGEGMW